MKNHKKIVFLFVVILFSLALWVPPTMASKATDSLINKITIAVNNHEFDLALDFIEELERVITEMEGNSGSESITKSENNNKDYDFRNVNWGMPVAIVKLRESAKLISGEKETPIYYETNIGNLKALLGYEFFENKLVSSIYSFEHQYLNKNKYIDNYNELKNLLKEKYGQPIKDEVTWENNLYKNDKEDYGKAVSKGHLAYESSWETSTTDIELELTGSSQEIFLWLIYKSKELYPLKEQAEKEQVLDQL